MPVRASGLVWACFLKTSSNFSGTNLEVYRLHGQITIRDPRILAKEHKGKTCYSFCNKTCLDRNNKLK
jgi:hypothetical protein